MLQSELYRRGISTVVITDHPKKGLLMYKGKGRPNAEEAEVLKCSELLRKAINKLVREMKFKPGTKVVLMLSLSTNEMIRIVSMIPKVWFMDVTHSTNHQKRDLF